LKEHFSGRRLQPREDSALDIDAML
jgi:hypothetical protein